ncbi:MAG TPA: TRAP transporter small permease [Alphaproteobacteria bacterium]|nr:TRAP transporter small permease [Alphaproteobacteria bacterium]
MTVLRRLQTVFERLLEIIVGSLMVGLTAVVVIAVVYRKAGASLVWYDEIASILLAWLTYYGSALAALKRGHIGFDGLLMKAPLRLRVPLAVAGEICVFAFFIILAWTGWVVLQVLAGDTLVSLPYVPVQLTQSVIPVGAGLFVLAEALSLPDYFRKLRLGRTSVQEEALTAIAAAEAQLGSRDRA